MSKVYIPQVPHHYDRSVKALVPNINIAPAKKWGEIVMMIEPGKHEAIVPLITAIREKMAEFNSDDWLVPVGSPTILMALGAIAGKRTNGLIRTLQWDKHLNDYSEIIFEVPS